MRFGYFELRTGLDFPLLRNSCLSQLPASPRGAPMLLLSVGILGRSTSVARPAGTLSVPVDHAAHGASVLTDNGRDKDVSKEKRADADLALRMAMDAGELAAIVIAIHATADIASLDVLDEARALRARIRQDMREGNHRKEVEPLSPAAADAGLRTAMEDRTLEGLVDAIHSNSAAASPEVLRAAKDVRDELRDEKHAAAGQKTETSKPGATTGQTAPMVPASSAIDADAALRAAMSARKLDGHCSRGGRGSAVPIRAPPSDRGSCEGCERFHPSGYSFSQCDLLLRN